MAKTSKKTLLAGGRRLSRIVRATVPAIARSLTASEAAPEVAFARFRGGREYAFLLTALAETGAVAVRAGDLYRASTRLPKDLFEKSVRIARTATPISLGHKDDGAGVIVDGSYYSAHDEPGSYRLPYFAHPTFYASGEYRTSRSARSFPRMRRVFFAGTINDVAYDQGFTFPIMRRGDIFRQIKADFSPSISDDMGGGRPITIISTSDTADDVKKHVLDSRAYMAALARTDFFICPPGWRMPNCHNMIEAMSVGAIPITNYAAYMLPPLADGVTCLSFSDGPSLKAAIDRALAMPAPEIATMRAAVVDYYDRHHEPVAAGQQLRARLPEISRIVTNDESGR